MEKENPNQCQGSTGLLLLRIKLVSREGVGYSDRFHTGMLHPRSGPLNLSHTILRKLAPFNWHLSLKRYPFHIPFPEKVPLSHTFPWKNTLHIPPAWKRDPFPIYLDPKNILLLGGASQHSEHPWRWCILIWKIFPDELRLNRPFNFIIRHSLDYRWP